MARRIQFSAALFMAFLLSSCRGGGIDSWSVINGSSQDLTVYYSEEPDATYAVAAHSSISIERETAGGIYVRDKPYSVGMRSEWREVSFYDKTKYSVTIENQSMVYDVAVAYTDTDGNPATTMVEKGSAASFNSESFETYVKKWSVTYTDASKYEEADGTPLVHVTTRYTDTDGKTRTEEVKR